MVSPYSFACLSCVALTSYLRGDWHDPSLHQVSFVDVEQDVRLELLDWGGSGLPLMFLAGLGNTAHVFDNLAPKLATKHHVYGITRRGYGQSSAPLTGYDTEQLAKDILIVLNNLKIPRAVLVGHSIAGEEMSWLGSHNPDRVAALVYIEAAADRQGVFRIPPDPKLLELRKKLPPPIVNKPGPADLASFLAMRSYWARAFGVAPPESELRNSYQPNAEDKVGAPRSPSHVAPRFAPV